MIRRMLALALLTASFWLLTQGVAQASHCGEVRYDAGRSSAGDCGSKAVTLEFVLGAAAGGAMGTRVVASTSSSGKDTVVAAAGPAPAGPGPSKKGSGKKGKPRGKAGRDAKSHLRSTRQARERAEAQGRQNRRAEAERSRARKAKAAGKNPPPGRTEQRVSRELNLDLQHEEGAVPTAGLGSGHSDWQSRSYQRNSGLPDLTGTFIQPQINFAKAALGETSADVPYPATPPPAIVSIGPAGGLDPLGSLAITTVMGAVLLGGWGWNLVSGNIPPIVKWDPEWKPEEWRGDK
jgi:hypothetical protein